MRGWVASAQGWRVRGRRHSTKSRVIVLKFGGLVGRRGFGLLLGLILSAIGMISEFITLNK
jgi:hypothetical protein